MQYRQLVKRVAYYSGFTIHESEMALQLFTETLAARLSEKDRKDFAAQLPKKLQEMTTDMPPDAIEVGMQDIYETFSELENINQGRAKKQVMAAWRALKDAMNPQIVTHIRSVLPQEMVTALR